MSVLSFDEVRLFVVEYLSDRLIAQKIDKVNIDDQFDILNSGAIDSLGMIEMIAALEGHFNVSIDYEDVDPDDFTVLGGFCRYSAEKAVADDG